MKNVLIIFLKFLITVPTLYYLACKVNFISLLLAYGHNISEIICLFQADVDELLDINFEVFIQNKSQNT